MRYHVGLILVISLFLAGAAFGQAIDPQNLLIRNVYLVGDEVDTLVNILIEDNKLAVVSQDDVEVEEGTSVIDGQEGYVLGKLGIGTIPSLLILNLNPLENFEVLLDTEDFAVFALNNGELRVNLLSQVEEDVLAEEAETTGRGWQAYTPPPMAVPLSYLDTTKWNRWESGWVSGIFLAGVVLDRIAWGSQDAASEAHHGDLNEYDGGEIRGFRLGAVGTINFKRPWVYTVFGATNAFDKGFEIEDQDNFTFFDYRVDIPLFKNANLSVGNQKEPISMERLMPMTNISMQERSAVADAMLPSRSFGIVMSGTLADQRMTWAAGAFNNWVSQSGGIEDNSTAASGRLTWLPWMSADESNLIHLGLGMRYTDVKKDVRFATEPEFNKAPIFVDTGFLDANDALQVSLEASWRRGPLWVGAETINTTLRSPTYGDLDFDGYQAFVIWTLTGEMRSYNKKSGIIGPTPVARTVQQGGKGAWELAARFSNIDLSDRSIDGGDMDILSLGVNWWLTPTFQVNANYRYITLNRGGFESNSDAIMTRVLLMLE
ncbi:MAG: hypothetical protein GWP62_14620 [Gammaproteobacteria bacterium]|jgi:phosphate-selective porin OprO/OprP|nr:hypothetical protein [Gammaproteobacteria bacterium]